MLKNLTQILLLISYSIKLTVEHTDKNTATPEKSLLLIQIILVILSRSNRILILHIHACTYVLKKKKVGEVKGEKYEVDKMLRVKTFYR